MGTKWIGTDLIKKSCFFTQIEKQDETLYGVCNHGFDCANGKQGDWLIRCHFSSVHQVKGTEMQKGVQKGAAIDYPPVQFINTRLMADDEADRAKRARLKISVIQHGVPGSATTWRTVFVFAGPLITKATLEAKRKSLSCDQDNWSRRHCVLCAS